MHAVITWFSEAQTWKLVACDIAHYGLLLQTSCFCNTDCLYCLVLHDYCNAKFLLRDV